MITKIRKMGLRAARISALGWRHAGLPIQFVGHGPEFAAKRFD